MECAINGRTFTFDEDIRDDRIRRLSFDALAQKTFGLSFVKWHDAGYWTDRYRPYVLLDGEKVVANASVNIMDTRWEGVPKRYIQLGTVMTDSAYRRLGLSRFLIYRILEDWLDHCDAIYLYANDAVLDFYPKFGFVKAEEYQTVLCVEPRNATVKRLDMADEADVATLRRLYQENNPFSALPMLDNWGLLMFYCADVMRDCVYHVADSDAALIAEQDQGIWAVFDVYCAREVTLVDAISAIAGIHPGCGQVRLGFAPKDVAAGESALLREEDTTLFVYAGKENVLRDHRTMFPLLSHA